MHDKLSRKIMVLILSLTMVLSTFNVSFALDEMTETPQEELTKLGDPKPGFVTDNLLNDEIKTGSVDLTDNAFTKNVVIRSGVTNKNSRGNS